MQIDASSERVTQKAAQLEELSAAEAEGKEAVRAAKEELEKEKAALRERNKVWRHPRTQFQNVLYLSLYVYTHTHTHARTHTRTRTHTHTGAPKA